MNWLWLVGGYVLWRWYTKPTPVEPERAVLIQAAPEPTTPTNAQAAAAIDVIVSRMQFLGVLESELLKYRTETTMKLLDVKGAP